MSGKWSGYFKIVTPRPSATKMTDSQEMTDSGAYNNYTWYQRLVQGSASRMTRYREYDLMDNDVEVARALDTIAEEMTGNNPKTKEPLLLDILSEDEDNIGSTAVLTLKAALRRWSQIHDFPNKLFSISRMSIKYGDLFFIKGDKLNAKWQFIHPKNVIAAVVDEKDATNILAWQIKSETNKPRTGGYGMPIGGKQDTQLESEIITVDKIIRFSLNDDMADTQPFGESILRPVYRSHKQKELLEDAIIIYRVQRAPERRVFYIDVGKLPHHRTKQFLEGIKNEIKQKKVPTRNGGQSEVDSVYNPHSMCLALDTKIPLLDGRILLLNEMIDEHEAGKQNWVYSINPKTGDIVPGIVSWAGVTRKNTETIKLILDNGDEIVCTPDHKFPVQGRGDERVMAKDLTPNDSLYPFTTTKSANVNHRINRIEQGVNQDTGTLTIDKEEKYHNYHTFATCSTFVFNSEDFYFAARADGKGSRVEVLPGGQGLGELADLEYFQQKVWRALKVPISYMQESSDGGATWNDGQIGTAYIQELRFSLYVERLQGYIERALDTEFKSFLRQCNILVDNTAFRITLPSPSNFGKYKQLQLDSQLLSAFATPDGLTYMSKRFALKRYLQMSDEEIISNERLKREEMGLDPDSTDEADLKIIYGDAAAEGAGGAAGLGAFGGAELGMDEEQPTETPDPGGPQDGNNNPVK